MKKIGKLLIIFVAILVVGTGFIYADYVPNQKEYNPTTQTMTINDWITHNKIADITLNTPLNNYVIIGKDRKVAEFTINSVEDFNNVFKEMEFYDLMDGEKKIERDFTYKVKSVIPYSMNLYEDSCKERDVNGTAIKELYDCQKVLSGIRPMEKIIWNNFNEKLQLEKGEITIGVFTDVKRGDYVEWIPTFFNVRINEWATWTDSLNLKLVAYYNFDNTSGAVVPESINNIYDGDNYGTYTWDAGILNQSLNYSQTGATQINNQTNADNPINSLGNATISVWVKPYRVDAGHQAIISMGGQGILNQSVFRFFIDANDDFHIQSFGTVGMSTLNHDVPDIIAPGAWNHLVWTINISGNYMFHNGSRVLNDSVGSGDFSFIKMKEGIEDFLDMGIWWQDGLGRQKYFAGVIDEVAFWNRSLTPSEVIQLYNDGVGITYRVNDTVMDVLPIALNTTLQNTPANFSALLNDTDGISGYRLASNTTGVWANTSWLALTGTIDLAEVNRMLPNSVTKIGWIFYANDSYDILYANTEQKISTISLTPSFSTENRNETLHGHPVNFSLLTTTAGILDGYIFSWNGSGAWVNDSYDTSIGGTNALIDENKLLPNINSTVVGWLVFVNSTTDNLGVSTQQEFIVNDTEMSFTNLNYNQTLHGHPVNFSAIINDTDRLSGFIFQTNNSGSSINTTWLTLIGEIALIDNITLLNNVNATPIEWKVWGNDSANLWYGSSYISFVINDTELGFFGASISTTNYSESANMSALLNDSEGLSHYWFSNNFSGAWDNETATSISGTIALVSNTTIISPYIDIALGWTIYANDSDGTTYVMTIEEFIVTILLQETIIDYPDPVAEGDTATIVLFLNSTNIPTANASLIWNNTYYIPTRTKLDANTYQFTRSIVVPSNWGNVLKAYKWYYNLTGTGINNYSTMYYNQTVKAFTLMSINETYACPSVGTGLSLNKSMCFNFANEINRTSFEPPMVGVNIEYLFKFGITNSTAKTINGSLNNITTACLCINATQYINYSLGYGEIHYGKTGYTNRRFYTFSTQRTTNKTINNTLYLLPNSDSTDFQLEFLDTGLKPYINNYTTLLHWYPEIDDYEVVEMARTDDEGKTILRIKTEDIDYRIALYYQSGELIKLLNPVRFGSCLVEPCDYTIYVSDEETDFTSYLGVQSQLLYNETTGIWTLVWNDPSQATDLIFLNITKETGAGQVLICSDSAIGSVGVLTCNTSGYTGVLMGAGYRTASPTVPFISVFLNLISTPFKSSAGLLFSAVIFLTITLAGVASPILAIILGIIGFIPSVIMGSVSMMTLLGLAVIAGVIIHFITKPK